MFRSRLLSSRISIEIRSIKFGMSFLVFVNDLKLMYSLQAHLDMHALEPSTSTIFLTFKAYALMNRFRIFTKFSDDFG